MDVLEKVGQVNMWFLSSGSSPHDPQSGLSFSLVLKRRSPFNFDFDRLIVCFYICLFGFLRMHGQWEREIGVG